ncbi:hypothetical protein DL93DRAFT_2225618, partial [Clavulina sp. PMI_390]
MASGTSSRIPSLLRASSARQNWVQVQDADEEIFLLYSDAATSQRGSSGLGSVNSRRGELEVTLDIEPHLGTGSGSWSSRQEPLTVSASLAQDVAGLRSRKGDTGSVVWRASVEFARTTLKDCLFPATAAFISGEHLKRATVLELGAGTGILAVLLAPYVDRYLATDLPSLVPLMHKNLQHNNRVADHQEVSAPRTKPSSSHPRRSRGHGGASVPIPLSSPASTAPEALCLPLDWDELYQTTSGSTARARYRASISFANDVAQHTTSRFDLVLAVDTLYNPSLVPSFLTVLDEFSDPPMVNEAGESLEPTLVLVACELRDESVLRDFLEGWIRLEGWEIWRLGGQEPRKGEDMGNELSPANTDELQRTFMPGPFVVWAGWKT